MDVSKLKSEFSGNIILPKDTAYAEVQNSLLFKGAPAVVLQPKSTDDVAAGIRYARENNLELSVRSGGHSGAGFSTNEKGVVIDLRHMNQIELLDPDRHIVRIGGGAKWIDIARELDKHGLALSSGDTKTVGVGGLTLGAGIGWMVRKFGLAIDSLVAAEVVSADGEVLRVSDQKNPDLFWALRGGGGNFGVVTAFEFEAHPVGMVYAGNIMYGLDDLPSVIKGWRDGMRNAPEELTTMMLAMPSFMGMPPMAMIMCCYAGDDKAEADKVLAPFRNLGKVLSDDVKEKHYFEVLEEAHIGEVGTVKILNKNGFVQDFGDELIKTITDMFAGSKTGPILQIRSVGGAMNRVAKDATAFAHRDSEALIVHPVFMDPGASAGDMAKALENWSKIEPFTNGGYIGFFSERDENIFTMYPEATYDRLAVVKKKYDPNNVFRQNFNIKPAK